MQIRKEFQLSICLFNVLIGVFQVYKIAIHGIFVIVFMSIEFRWIYLMGAAQLSFLEKNFTEDIYLRSYFLPAV